jgi:ribonuclease P protein component
MDGREDRLPRWRSLSDRREFERIYGEGAKQVGRLFVLYLLPAAEFAKAVVASRKVGGAVRRNRAKRLLREGLRKSRLGDAAGAATERERLFPEQEGDASTEAARRGLWIVAVARSRILTATSADVTVEVHRLLDAARPAQRSR